MAQRQQPTAACDSGPVVEELIARLRHRRGELLAATRGRGLRLQVTLTQSTSTAYWLVVTADGTVGSVEPRTAGAKGFAPHLIVVGTPLEVRRALTGEDAFEDVVGAGTLVCQGEGELYSALFRIVGEELTNVLDVG